jgi:hypothetical protein
VARAARRGPGGGEGIEKDFDGPLDCTVEVLQDGSIFQQPLDLSKASQAQCLATGELGYSIVHLGVAAGKAVATGDFRSQCDSMMELALFPLFRGTVTTGPSCRRASSRELRVEGAARRQGEPLPLGLGFGDRAVADDAALGRTDAAANPFGEGEQGEGGGQ